MVSATEPSTQPPGRSGQPREGQSAEADPRARRVARLAELFEDPSPTQAPQQKSPQVDAELAAEEEGEDTPLAIPPDLERYVSPDLWRRIQSPNPPRGVLINALDRVRSVLNLLSTFLPGHLVQEKMRRPVAGLVNGQVLSGTLLFSDVSGFTALSERLQEQGAQGAERLTAVMNLYFTRMVEIIAWSGGTLLKFAGDAMLVYFPAQAGQAQAGWAVRAGQRMLRAIAEFGEELAGQQHLPRGVTLKMKIGVATGEFLAASVGSEKRMEYVILGATVTRTLAAEGASTAAGQLVVDGATREALDVAQTTRDHKNGFALVSLESEQALDDFEIRAETRRARGAMAWNASPHALIAQTEVALRQVAAILPYLPPEVVDRVVVRGQRAMFTSRYQPTTVIFCNVWGYEPLMEVWQDASGVQRVTGLFNAYFGAMNEIITRYGGIVSRIDPYSRGTKLLILFGAPVAHEDDPQRAVSAALAMNAEMEMLNDNWRRKFARYLPPDFSGALLQHRMGLTSGVTFAGQVGSPTRREYTVMGDEVNLSARLMSAAEAGQILTSLSPEVRAAIADGFVLAPLQAIRVKGKSRSIDVDQVQGPREDFLDARLNRRGVLVGRRSELAQAEMTLQLALTGTCSLLTLTGPAGIGKSRLADELLNSAQDRGVRLLFHSCRSYAATTLYAGWSSLLRSFAGITPVDYLPSVHQARLRQMVQRLALPEAILPALATLMGLKGIVWEQPAQEADGGVDDVLALVRGGRERRRVSSLDVLEQLSDGQVSDSGQVWQPVQAQLSGRERERVYAAVLSVLGAAARERPLLIFFEDAHWMDDATRDLISYVIERGASLPLLFLLAQRSDGQPGEAGLGQVIQLAPLDLEATTALVAHLLVSDLAPVIQAQSNGVPLFVEEITRWFRRTRNISAGELERVLESSNVLQKLVLSGLESLPEQQREVALVASVVGNDFRTGEVQALLPAEIDAVTLSLHLRSLARARLVALVEAGADARYAFQQALVRDVLYQSLPLERRKALHACLAEYLNRPRSRRSALQSRLAAALDTQPAADPGQAAEIIAGHYELAEDWLAAARSLGQAGDQAMAAGGAARAAVLYAQALADLEQAALADAAEERAGLKRRWQMAQADALLLTAQYLPASLLYDALSAVEDAQRMAPDSFPPDTALAYRQALVLPLVRRGEEGESRLRRALQANPEAPAELSLALAWLAARNARPDACERIADARQALAQAAPGWKSAAFALLDELEGQYESAGKAYRALGCPLEAGWVELRHAEALMAAGQLSLAQTHLGALEQDLPEDQTGAYPGALVAYRQAEIHWKLGRPDQALAALETVANRLDLAAPELAAEGETALQQARKLLGRARSGKRAWPAWHGQDFEDRLRLEWFLHTVNFRERITQ